MRLVRRLRRPESEGAWIKSSQTRRWLAHSLRERRWRNKKESKIIDGDERRLSGLAGHARAVWSSSSDSKTQFVSCRYARRGTPSQCAPPATCLFRLPNRSMGGVCGFRHVARFENNKMDVAFRKTVVSILQILHLHKRNALHLLLLHPSPPELQRTIPIPIPKLLDSRTYMNLQGPRFHLRVVFLNLGVPTNETVTIRQSSRNQTRRIHTH